MGQKEQGEEFLKGCLIFPFAMIGLFLYFSFFGMIATPIASFFGTEVKTIAMPLLIIVSVVILFLIVKFKKED